MSRLDNPLSEIHSGTHLVVILEASILRDQENLPVIAKDGSNGINIRFNDNKLNHDKVFWTKSSDFKKLCNVTSCDITKPIIPQLKGKSLWMCVKEVKTMKEDVHVSSDYVAFDYLECVNPTQKPIISGDPCQHPKGIPLGVFVEYKQLMDEKYGTSVPIPFNTKEDSDVEIEREKARKFALGKQIIAEGEGKQMTSLNEKNTHKEEVKEEEDLFAQAESHGESNDNNNVETDPDWDDL